MFKKTMIATALLLAFATTGANAQELTITESGTISWTDNHSGNGWAEDLTVNVNDGLDLTMLTTGWGQPNVSAAGATVTIKNANGWNNPLIYNDGNYRVNPTITAKKLNFVGENLWGPAIYAMVGTTTINADEVDFDVKSSGMGIDLIFVNTGANVVLNVKKSITSSYADSASSHDINVADGTLTINSTGDNTEIDLGNILVGHPETSKKGELTISNENGKTSLQSVTVLDNATDKTDNSNITIAGNTTINGDLTVKTEITAKGDLALKGTNAIENLKGDVTVALVEGTATAVTNNTAKLRLVATGAMNDSLLMGDAAKVAELGLFRIDNALGDETITLKSGLVAPEVTTKLNTDGTIDESTLDVQGNPVQEATADLSVTLPLTLTRALTNDVRKRLGDIRTAQGTHGVWARYDGGKMSGDGGFENKFNTVQVGIDTVPTPNSARFGLAFSYTDGESEFGSGKSDLQAFSLAAYSTWFADNGLFVDVIGRMATAKNDMKVTVDNLQYKGKTDNTLLSLSGELGWRYDLNSMFYAEPQAELTYTYVDGDNFKLGYANYETDYTNSLVGRLGAAFGVKCPNNKGNAYVRASVVREFLGDAKVMARTPDVDYVFTTEVETKDTWFEYGIGANYNINDNVYVWADVERTAGGLVDEDVRGTVGIRYSF